MTWGLAVQESLLLTTIARLQPQMLSPPFHLPMPTGGQITCPGATRLRQLVESVAYLSSSFQRMAG